MAEIFEGACTALGFSVIVMFIAFYILWFLSWLKKVLKKQKKIKCLCEHEFEIEYQFDFVNEYASRTEYDLKCRKCGKKKSMVIYRKKEGDSDD